MSQSCILLTTHCEETMPYEERLQLNYIPFLLAQNAEP